MIKYVEFVKKRRKILFIFFVVITLFLAAGISRLNLNSDFKIFIPRKSETKEILEEMETMFPVSEQVIYMLEFEKEINYERFEKLKEIQRKIASGKNVLKINGPAPELVFWQGKMTSLNELNKKDIEKLLENYKNQGKLSPIRKKDGITYAIFTVFFNEDLSYKDVKEIESYLKVNDLKFYATGNSYMQIKIMDYLMQILRFIPPMALIFILLVFRLQLGSIKATLLSVLPAGLGAIWTVGIIGWTGLNVSIISVLAPIFTIVIGSADGLHFISHIQDEREEGKTNLKSIVNTLNMVGIPMIITTITSMAGFLALLVMNTEVIRELAYFASLGIFLAGVITWYILPVILVGDMDINSKVKNRNNIKLKFLKRAWGFPSVLIFLTVLFVFVSGFFSLQTEFNMSMMYKKSTDIYKGNEKILEINEGSLPIFAFAKIEGELFDEKNEFEISELTGNLEKLEEVASVVDIYKVFEMLSSMISQSENVTDEDMVKLKQMFLMIPNSPAHDLYSINKRAVKLMIFPKDQTNDTLKNIEEEVSKFNSETQFNFKLTGTQFMLKELNDSMLSNQVNSSAFALLLVFLLVFISIRKFIPSLVSTIPVVASIMFLFGFLGMSGISLNILTTTIFSITIGVGIDYAIHYSYVFMKLKKKMGAKVAVEKAYSYTARPIVANAFGLAIGLSSLLISPLQLHMYVALLMWVTMMTSILFSLTFLPSVFRKLKD